MTVPSNIIYFTGYDWLRFNKASFIKELVPDIYTPLVGGAFARTVAAISISPIEMFRTRIQASTSTSSAGHFADTLKGIGDMVQTQGYTSLWRGLTLTLWRDVPFSGFYWLGYETFKGLLSNFRERSRGRRFNADDSTRKTRTRSQNQEDHTVILYLWSAIRVLSLYSHNAV
jgi:solute carrier family 25, member 39/40